MKYEDLRETLDTLSLPVFPNSAQLLSIVVMQYKENKELKAERDALAARVKELEEQLTNPPYHIKEKP